MEVETRTQEGETKMEEVERLNREKWVREANRSIKVRRENFQKKWAKLTEKQRMRILKRMAEKSVKFHESMVGYSAQYEKDNPGCGGFLFGAPKDAKDPNAACLTFQADVTFDNAGKEEVVFCKRE